MMLDWMLAVVGLHADWPADSLASQPAGSAGKYPNTTASAHIIPIKNIRNKARLMMKGT